MGKRSEVSEPLALTISGRRNEINIGKRIIRVLHQPEYLGFRVNKARTAIILFPCEASDPMSYKVPENILTEQNRLMRIYSKAFVRDTLLANHLDIHSTYTVYGTYIEKHHLVRFRLDEAFENRIGSEVSD